MTTKLLNFSKAELIFISKASQASFKKLKNIKQTVIWNGVKQISSTELKNNISESINILLLGRLNSWKGQSLLVKAMSLLLNETIEKISVRIVGDVYSKQHQIKKSLDRQIENLNLHNTIKILPFTNHPEVHYNWTKIVIVPSLLPEPFGLVAIEAMSIGKIVIAANHGGLTEIVKNNITGLTFNPGNAEDLADKITFAVNNTVFFEELSKNAFFEYKRNFTEEICIKNLKKII